MSPPLLAVLDYGMGNRRSVHKALEHVGAQVLTTRDPVRLRAADGIVVPGVGAFPLAMARLAELGLDRVLRERADAGVPILGICLGMQLLLGSSVELRPTRGLDLISGEVRLLAAGGRRVPHIGWNEVRFERPCALTEGLPPGGCPFYHVHSFAAHPTDPEDLVGTTEYGERFATILARGSVFGVQFHPEKSSTHGLAMLANFATLCAAAGQRSAAA